MINYLWSKEKYVKYTLIYHVHQKDLVKFITLCDNFIFYVG